MATTTNFGWETPDDTDLVKDGAAAMRTLGNSIDASFVDLKGGTTGQVLSKNSNTDLDFTWVAQDDSNAIQNAIVDAKGDLIAASAADTPARLAVGNNGETLVADSSATTGLRWQGNYAAGKNAIINGDMRIWQRGTSFTALANTTTYTVDRFYHNRDGSGATVTISQQAFTAGAAPVAGYEAPFFVRVNQSVAGTGTSYSLFGQRIEDVRTFAGQTVTVSFWAKADSNRTFTPSIEQNFGSGGSSNVYPSASSSITVTTSWARYSTTFNLGSMSGKTIGTGSNLFVYFDLPKNTTFTFDLWGLQIELGNVATAFQTATGTLAGELAACQRYYYKTYAQGTAPATNTSAGSIDNITGSDGGGNAIQTLRFPVTMRGTPTITVYRNSGASGSWDYSRSGASGTGAVTVDTWADSAIRFYLGIGANWTLAQTYGHIVATAEL